MRLRHHYSQTQAILPAFAVFAMLGVIARAHVQSVTIDEAINLPCFRRSRPYLALVCKRQ